MEKIRYKRYHQEGYHHTKRRSPRSKLTKMLRKRGVIKRQKSTKLDNVLDFIDKGYAIYKVIKPFINIRTSKEQRAIESCLDFVCGLRNRH